MYKLIDKYKKSRVLKKYYFDNMQETITETNINLLFIISIAIAGMVIIMIPVAIFLLSEFSINIIHIIFAPFSLVFSALAYALKKGNLKNSNLINLLCCSYMMLVGMCIIGIDVVPYTESLSTLMPLVLVLIPAIFIMSMPWILVEMFVVEGEYLISLFLFKSVTLASADTFNSIIGFLFGLIMGFIITNLRCQDNNSMLEYKKLSRLDALTGILNKGATLESINIYLSKPYKKDRCAFLIIDIDNFKQINDSLGHQAGDEILMQVGKMLDGMFRSDDIVGRFGGDEFTVFIKDAGDEKFIYKKCELIIDKFGQIEYEDLSIGVTCSIGVVIASASALTYEKMFAIADDALYEAKSKGKCCYEIKKV